MLEAIQLATAILTGGAALVRAVRRFMKAWHEDDAEEAARIVREKRSEQAAGRARDKASKMAGPGGKK